MDEGKGSQYGCHVPYGPLISAIKALVTRRSHERMTDTTVPAWDDVYNQQLERDGSGMPLENFYGRQLVVVDYQKYVRKGQKLVQYLDMTTAELNIALIAEGKVPPGATDQSQFSQHSMLATHGWEADVVTDDYLPALYTAMNGLGKLGSVMDINKAKLIDTMQRQPYMHAGSQRNATNASYTGLYCPAEGLIISTEEFSPRHQILKGLPPPNSQTTAPDLAPVPALTHWSDVVFLTYENLSSELDCEVRGLKHIIRDNIDNKATHKVIEFAMNKYNKSFPAPKWEDRHVFYSGEEGANAILATPNGRGVAWLVLTHRTQLGRKRIKSIAVFERDGDQDEKIYGPSLYFELEDVL